MEGFLAAGLTSAFSAAGKLLLSSVSLESSRNPVNQTKKVKRFIALSQK